MSFIKKLGIIILVIILFLSIIILNTTLGLKQLLYPQIYQEAIGSMGIYSLLENQTKGLGEINFVKINPKGLGVMINEALEKTLSYLRGDSKNLELYWEINTSSIKELFLEQANKTRICSSGEVNTIEKPCRDESMSVEKFLEAELDKRNFTFLENNQTRINVLDIYDKERRIEKLKDYVNYYYKGLYLLTIIIAVIITIIILLERKKLKIGMIIVGLTSLISGIMMVITSKVIGNLAYTEISTVIPIFKGGIIEIISPIFHSIMMSGIITLIIGFVIIMTAIFLPKKEEEKKLKN